VCRYCPLNIIFQQYDSLLHKLPNWMEQILFQILVLLRLFYLFFILMFEKDCLVVFLKGKLIELTKKIVYLLNNTYWFAFKFLSFNIIKKYSSHRKFIIKFSSWSLRPQYSSPCINFFFTTCPVNFKSLVLILRIICL
jgi:hypothetical protein